MTLEAISRVLTQRGEDHVFVRADYVPVDPEYADPTDVYLDVAFGTGPEGRAARDLFLQEVQHLLGVEFKPEFAGGNYGVHSQDLIVGFGPCNPRESVSFPRIEATSRTEETQTAFAALIRRFAISWHQAQGVKTNDVMH